MNINASILKNKIAQYFNKDITKEELGLWALKFYYELMQGEYIHIEKLKVYHFLRTLSTFHIVPNDIKDEYPCSEEDVLNIYDVLCGNKNTNYTFNLKINKRIYEQINLKSKKIELDEIRDLVIEFSASMFLDKPKMSVLVNYAKKELYEVNDLVAVLESNIIGMLFDNIDFESETFDFIQKVGIYVGGKSINEKNFSSSILKLFSCIDGNDFFRICISYTHGICTLTLILI